MKLLNFSRYFFYLATRWNFRIACHIIPHEIRGEKLYGISTTGTDNLSHLEKKGVDTSHATMYMPVSYDLLESVFKEVNISRFRHFIDFGCGQGRAMCVAAAHGVKQLTGIDFSSRMTGAAQENLRTTQKKYGPFTATVFTNDAFYFEIPDDADCLFFFNPFDEVIMSGVAENIAASLENSPRTMTIIYINPLQKEVLSALGFREVFHTKKLRYLEALVMRREI